MGTHYSRVRVLDVKTEKEEEERTSESFEREREDLKLILAEIRKEEIERESKTAAGRKES
jgi:hypothetical protein